MGIVRTMLLFGERIVELEWSKAKCMLGQPLVSFDFKMK